MAQKNMLQEKLEDTKQGLQNFGDKLQDKLTDDEGNVLLLEKGKRGLLHVIFGRTAVIILALLLQLLLWLFLFIYMRTYLPYVWAAMGIVAILVVIHIINRSGETTSKLTWIVLISLVPVLGAILYLWVHTDFGHRLEHKRLREVIEQTGGLVRQDEEVLAKVKAEEPQLSELAAYMDRNGGYPVYSHATSRYLPTGEANLEAMLVDLENAKSFIFLEYFIVDEGYMWGRVLDILRRKVEEGVEVRMMYDGTCSIFRLPYGYPKKLQALGIQCKMFAPPRPVVSTHYNNRDHRKILVIDGQVAYTGGVNLADEYINRKTIYGKWKDVAIRVQGDAVRSFTLMFLQMWNMDTEGDQYEKYLDCTKPVEGDGGYLLPYGDSPLDSERVGEMVYCDILNRAHRYVHIMTPYLILDDVVRAALMYAAERGVQVQIILPHIPDKTYAFALAKTHYKELVSTGVEIYEYTPGFIHAKVFTSDDEKAVVGTINLDYRSLYHHFECGLYMHHSEEISRVEQDFQETLKECHRITQEDIRNEKLKYRVMGALLKVVAPLL